MKKTLVLIVLLIPSFCFAAENNILNKAPKTQNKPTAEEIDPIEADKRTDIILFNNFIKILAYFANILIDPHNKVNVTSNAAKMIDGVVAVAQELTKRGQHPTEKQMKNIIRLLLKALQKQGLLVNQQDNIVSFTYEMS